ASAWSASCARPPASCACSAASCAWSEDQIPGSVVFSADGPSRPPCQPTLLEFGKMDSSAIPVFQAGPFPVVYSAEIDEIETEVQLDVALLIQGQPNIVASTAFPYDDTWDRIRAALDSGDARLEVAGVPHEEESNVGVVETYPSA